MIPPFSHYTDDDFHCSACGAAVSERVRTYSLNVFKTVLCFKCQQTAREQGQISIGRGTEARVVHCKREKYDVYIGRGSKWGNPFRIGPDGTREEVIEKYAAWILRQPELMSSLHELKGKVLGCWCKPLACHGDVLAELAERALPRMLPTTVIDDKTYFVDERLRQLRNVKNPHDYIDLDG